MEEYKAKSHRLRLTIALVVLLAAAAALYLLWTGQQTGQASSSNSEIQTAAVRLGNLSMTVSGTGDLIAAHTYDLGFSTGGTVQTLDVQIGDQVTAGQALAAIDGGDELQVEIEGLQLDLTTAQQSLDELLHNGDETLVQAQIDLADAQSALNEAQKNLRQKGQQRCTSSQISTYYNQYLYAQIHVDQWEPYLTEPSGYGTDFLLDKLYPLRQDRDRAYENWKYCEGYTEKEIVTSQAALGVAQAASDKAQRTYDTLLANQGIDPQAVALAELEVKNAQMQLDAAQQTLAGLQIVAPADGVVTAIAGQGGEAADTAAFITLSDLNPPEVEAYIDETDLEYIQTGCSAQVTFDAIAGRTFTGEVTEIYPQMVTVNGYGAVLTTVALDDVGSAAPGSLPIGLKASVDVTCSQAQDVLIVPVQAVQVDDAGKYIVMLQSDDGQIEPQQVEVGMQTLEYVEIRSGLQEGQRVVVSGYANG